MNPKLALAAALSLFAVALLLLACPPGDNNASGDGGGPVVIERPTELPEDYAGLPSPIAELTPEQLERAKQMYTTNCEPCHGPLGLGDGPTGVALNPSPGDLSDPKFHEAVGDDYIFWRITTGAKEEPFKSGGSGMTDFGRTIGEEDRWLVVAYVRMLNTDYVAPDGDGDGDGDGGDDDGGDGDADDDDGND